MFRSFFPSPKLFFTSALVWLLLATTGWYAFEGPIRNAISLDRFVIAPMCAPAADPVPETNPAETAPGTPPSGEPEQASPAAAAPAESAVTNAVAAPACTPEGAFLTGEQFFLYQYVLLIALIFCAFWYIYRRNEWYWWSVVGSTAILLVLYFNVQVDAFINNWQGTFFNTLQSALSTPGSVSPETLYGEIFTIMAVVVPRILVLVLLAFLTSHYVFRWRKAMNAYYMQYWPAIRTTEGAAQRVQEDTMRFAQIVEDLGTSFFDALITLAVFIPILWGLSRVVTELPIFGIVPGSLVWVALASAAFGTLFLGVVGIRLPGLQFENQKVEAAYRKELVYGEDNGDRAEPMTVRELFANVQKNYYRIYWHYTYFNFARYGYLQLAGYIPILVLAPSILAGALTLGLYQQVQQAFGQVASSFQFLARAWGTVIELLSVHKRLRRFESFIPKDAPPINPSVSDAATI
ncbi:peptide/bleomycin uptake transporter [Devosia lucknowensis]|uniref:Peptide/bleomycin uptake transporter n=1 Tax=Devosia lucknowensis TaxID=1096929 RepID=A0A1Y6EUI8_9HYPH|nr:SbmA/BacA-like family transporter [Devosia lucknowensis]SMQ66365.1 peptide/bleomycin uptake transporter [Devosia lucknowensis]